MTTTTKTQPVIASDMWGTPPAVARATVEVLAELMGWDHETRFMEPCHGDGAFIDALKGFGFRNYGGFESNPKFALCPRDCLMETWADKKVRVTIGNPPYSNWLAHIEHYKQMSKQVVQILRMQSVLEPTKGDKNPSRVPGASLREGLRYVFPLQRVRFVPLAGQKAMTDSYNTAVFVWQRGYTGMWSGDDRISMRVREIEGGNA